MSFLCPTVMVLSTVALSLIFLPPALPAAAQQAHSDPTLEPIAADEPIPPSMFPPFPDRLNLTGAIATTVNATPTTAVRSQPARSSSFHQGYGHVPAGAYIQHQQPGAAPSSRDSYNVNTGTTAAPKLPELPSPVTVSQSTTQDLSLPDDEFSDYHKKKKHGSYMRYMLPSYMMGAAGMGLGMGLGSLRY